MTTVYHGADMSKPAAIEDMIRAAESSFGQIDILVNNAGIQHSNAGKSFPVDRWDAIIAINLTSAFSRCLILPKMTPSTGARIDGSVAGTVALSLQKVMPCSLAKHRNDGFPKSVALKLAG